MERSRDWMEQAESDLEHAKKDMENGFHNWACFSAQQSAEKGVKAVFQKMGAVAWGHSVADLLQELSQFHKPPEGLHDAALELDKAYIPTRYPDAHPSEPQVLRSFMISPLATLTWIRKRWIPTR